jgi:hypothetical protein
MSYPTHVPQLEVQHQPGRPPLLYAQAPGGAAHWAATYRHALRGLVTTHGAVLVRGLALRDRGEIGATFAQLGGGHLLPEREAFAPREAYYQGVYSSTPWPAHQQMCMHHELSYTVEFPGMMMFACLTPPAGGGATAVSDAADVLRALPPGLVERFEREGWLLVRNYNDEIGASYADAFGTPDRGAVEHYCRTNGIDFEWQADGGLRTWQRRYAIARHPRTGQRCWFNQVAFLNEWTLEPEIREYLVEVYGSDGLPFNTRFGHGEPVGPDVVALINQVYTAHTRREPWQAGDLLLVDNIRTAHSREPFEGPREVLVAMTDPVRISDCAPQPAGVGR